MISRFNNEPIKLKLTFDNGEVYECNTENRNDAVLINFDLHESEGNMHGNPLGIMSSNNASFSILDTSGVLIKENKNSPYYGFMRNGVRCEIQHQLNGAWYNLGIFYTNSWNNTKVNGGYQTAVIGAQDRLNYIGNLNIPELQAFSSIEIKDLLIEIFTAIGLDASEYYIDQNLDLTLTFSVTRGAKLRDTLNAIAQALIARVSIDRDGIINIKPAFPEIPSDVEIVDARFIGSGTLKQNQYSDYATVQLSFYELGIEQSIELANIPNVSVESGENDFNNIQLSNRVQGIDVVTFEYNVDPDNYIDIISDISYAGYQGGVSVSIVSNNDEQVNGIITVDGRETGNSEVVLSKPVINADRKVSNTLMLESPYIQTRRQAENYLNSVVDYINHIRNSGAFDQTLLGFDLKTGIYIRIDGADIDIDGIYYVNDIHFSVGETFVSSFNAIKFDGGV